MSPLNCSRCEFILALSKVAYFAEHSESDEKWRVCRLKNLPILEIEKCELATITNRNALKKDQEKIERPSEKRIASGSQKKVNFLYIFLLTSL
jgi:hypothetical protein